MQLRVTTNQLTDVQRDIESFSREMMQGKAVLKSLKGQETSVLQQYAPMNLMMLYACVLHAS